MEDDAQLIAQTGSGEAGGASLLDGTREQLCRVRLQRELQAQYEAHGTKHPGRVILKAALMQHAKLPRLHVRLAVMRIDEAAEALRIERHRHRIRGEVAAREILRQRRGLDDRQRSGARVGLGARTCDVKLPPISEHQRGGHEAAGLVHTRVETLGQGVGDGLDRALHGDVEVRRLPPEQEVAHRATDEERARMGPGGGRSDLRQQLPVLRSEPIVYLQQAHPRASAQLWSSTSGSRWRGTWSFATRSERLSRSTSRWSSPSQQRTTAGRVKRL